jgi:hypothetical protein
MTEKPATYSGNKDWLTPLAFLGGGAALIVGGYYILHKPGLKPGQDGLAKFSFAYAGPPMDVILQISLGKVTLVGNFDHVEGLTWSKQVNLPQPGNYKFDILLPMTDSISSGNYDAEALVRAPGSDWLEYLPGGKYITKNAFIIQES